MANTNLLAISGKNPGYITTKVTKIESFNKNEKHVTLEGVIKRPYTGVELNELFSDKQSMQREIFSKELVTDVRVDMTICFCNSNEGWKNYSIDQEVLLVVDPTNS